MRVKPENFYLLDKYKFHQGFYMEDHNDLRFEISAKDYWVRFNHIDHDIYIVINKYGEICIHNVGSGVIGYDIPLPDVLVRMCKDGLIETQSDMLIDVIYKYKIKGIDCLNKHVVGLDKYELAAAFLLYVLKNNVYKGSNIQKRFNLHNKADNQFIIYILEGANKIKHAYLAKDNEEINDLIKKHFSDENILITLMDCWDREEAKYIKIEGVTVYKY